MGKVSEVTKSRIWLYGLVIGGIALCALLVNAWNLNFIRQNGAALVPGKTVAEAADADRAYDLAALAQQADEKALFDEQDVEQALSAGQLVLARVTPQGEPARYVRVTGAARDEAFFLRDETGAAVPPDSVRFYALCLIAPENIW